MYLVCQLSLFFVLFHSLVTDIVLNRVLPRVVPVIRHFEKKLFVIADSNGMHIESSCSSFEFDLSLPYFPRAIGQHVKPSPTLALKSPSVITLSVGKILMVAQRVSPIDILSVMRRSDIPVGSIGSCLTSLLAIANPTPAALLVPGSFPIQKKV